MLEDPARDERVGEGGDAVAAAAARGAAQHVHREGPLEEFGPALALWFGAGLSFGLGLADAWRGTGPGGGDGAAGDDGIAQGRGGGEDAEVGPLVLARVGDQGDEGGVVRDSCYDSVRRSPTANPEPASSRSLSSACHPPCPGRQIPTSLTGSRSHSPSRASSLVCSEPGTQDMLALLEALPLHRLLRWISDPNCHLAEQRIVGVVEGEQEGGAMPAPAEGPAQGGAAEAIYDRRATQVWFPVAGRAATPRPG